MTNLDTLILEIEKRKEEEGVLHIYDSVVSIVRDILRLEGIDKVSEDEMVKMFESALVVTGKLPDKFLRTISLVIKAKKEYAQKKLSKVDVDKVRKEAGPLLRGLVEYVQRKRGRELDRARIRVKYGNKYGEVVILDKDVFIIEDVDAVEKSVQKGNLSSEGGIEKVKKSSPEEMEKSLAAVQIMPRVFIREKLLEDLKKLFGRDLEILVNY